jgi:epsilon-lactone hydrolase
MQSLKSRILFALIRHRHLFKGRLRKERFDATTSIAAFRESCERSAARLSKLSPGVRIEPTTVGGVPAEWLIPSDAAARKAILYVHGGGYVSGSCADHRGFVSSFARRLGVACLTFDYRLAPEHPFPAAVEDSVAAYRGLIGEKGIAPGDVLVAGESAGGGLALALLLALRDQAIPLPAAAVAISPWTDLTCSSESYRTRNARSVAPLDSWWVFSAHYAGKADRRNPWLSPVFGDLAGLPPILVNSGTDDELFDDGRIFVERAQACGCPATFCAGEGMIHCYPMLSPMFREAREAMDEIAAFAHQHLRIAAPSSSKVRLEGRTVGG